MQGFQRPEEAVRERFAQFLKAALGRVELRTVSRQEKRLDTLRPGDSGTAVAASPVHNQQQSIIRVSSFEVLKEDLETNAVKARQVEAQRVARSGFHSGVEPEPLVLVLHDPRRLKAKRTPALAVPALEPKACFAFGEDPQPLAFLSGVG